MNGSFEEINGNKCLTLVSTNESKKNENVWGTVWDLIRLAVRKSEDYDQKYIKIKFHSDDELPLNKTIKIPVMITVVRAIFHENNKYYPQDFFRWIPLWNINNIKILYYDIIDVSDELKLIKQGHVGTRVWCLLLLVFLKL